MRPPPAPATIASAKLAPPRGTGRLMPRDRLVAQLLDARHKRCVVMQGPAGYGKTSLLMAWRQATLALGDEVAWLSLTAQDNEPTRLLDGLVAALAQVDPAIAQAAAELAGHGIDSAAIECTVITLIKGVSQHPRRVALVLDDLHQIEDPRIHEALQWLLDYAPDKLQLVLASRGHVPLSLARLRAEDSVLELDLRDLRFSPEESERFLRSQLGDVAHSDAVRLHELTDGWAAGLQLYAIGWKAQRRRPGTRAGSPAVLPSTHLHDASAFAAYFEREVLAQLAPAELDLLTSVSVCNRFCAPLGAALTGRENTVAEVLTTLMRVESANLFIVPLEDGERETWYRLHPLLKETLRARFGTRDPEAQRRVHRAAWRWFRKRGLLDEAIFHAVQADESAAAADLLEHSARDLAVRGELRTLTGLVRQLPPQELQARPGLRLWMLRVGVYANDLPGSLSEIRRLREELPADDAASRFALVQLEATLAVQSDDTAAAMALLPQLQQAPRDADVMTLGSRDNILSWLHLHRGEFERARLVQLNNPSRLIDGVPLLGTSSGTLQGRCLIGLSFALQGKMREAERIYRDVLYESERGGGACSVPAHLARALLGEVLYEANEPQAVLQLLEPRVDVLERVSIPDSVLRLLYMLSASHWLLGRQVESFAYLERLEEYASERGLDRLLTYSLAAQAQRQLDLGKLELAHALLQRLDGIELKQPNTDSLAYAEAAAVSARVRIRWLIAHERLAEALERIDEQMLQMQAKGRQKLIAQLSLLRAVVENRRGRSAESQAHVLIALRLGQKLGLLRGLLDTDPAALSLIRAAASAPDLDPVLAFYLDKISPLTEGTPPGAAGAPAPSERRSAAASTLGTLSERELDVLRLLAQALPNKKIARSLALAPETVKWHLKNIYGKLGVSSRDGAVARLRALELEQPRPD